MNRNGNISNKNIQIMFRAILLHEFLRRCSKSEYKGNLEFLDGWKDILRVYFNLLTYKLS